MNAPVESSKILAVQSSETVSAKSSIGQVVVVFLHIYRVALVRIQLSSAVGGHCIHILESILRTVHNPVRSTFPKKECSDLNKLQVTMESGRPIR